MMAEIIKTIPKPLTTCIEMCP